MLGLAKRDEASEWRFESSHPSLFVAIKFKAGKFVQWCCEWCKSHDRGRSSDGMPSNFCNACEIKFRKCITDWKSKKDPMWMIRSKGGRK